MEFFTKGGTISEAMHTGVVQDVRLSSALRLANETCRMSAEICTTAPEQSNRDCRPDMARKPHSLKLAVQSNIETPKHSTRKLSTC